MSVDELKEFVLALRNVRMFHGLTVHAEVDRQYNAGVRMTLRDLLNTVTTAMVVFQLADPKVTTEFIMGRLGDELAAAVKELWLKSVKGNQYNGDGSPVKLVESLSLDKVVRL
jgi:hypothetical protein